MPASPLTSQTDLPTVKILVEGQAIKEFYQVWKVEIDKEVNKIATAQVVLLDGDPAEENFEISESEDFVPGKKIEISLGYHSQEEIAFKGIIMAQNIKVRSYVSGIKSFLTIKCADDVVKLTVGRKSQFFKDKKDSEAITSILADAGIQKSVEATTFQHKKIVQYNCTDWDFILSRAEINGFLAICNNGKLEIGPPDFSGEAPLGVTYGVDVIDIQAEMDARTQLAAVATKSWDGTQLQVTNGQSTEPSVNSQGDITGKKLSDVIGLSTFDMQTTVPEDASVLKAWANARLLRSRLAKLKGSITIPGSTKATPGKLIQLSGFGKRFNGDAFISKVGHVLENGKWQTEVGFGMSDKWFSDMPGATGAPASGLLPGIAGLQIGTVKQIDQDPDGEFRILVDMPMIEEGGEGVWARMANLYSSDSIGMFFIPEIGDEVVLGFLNEDPRFPVLLGSLYGKKLAPPYTPEAENNTKGIVTKSNMKLTFEEDKKNITIETPGGNKITISDDQKSITLEDQNGNKVALTDSGISLDSPKDIKITTKGNFSVDATSGVTIKSTGDAALQGNNVDIKANIGFTAQGSAQAALKASGQVEVKGAMVMIN